MSSDLMPGDRQELTEEQAAEPKGLLDETLENEGEPNLAERRMEAYR